MQRVFLSGGYLFTELGFEDGFRGGFHAGFWFRIYESPHARESKTVQDSLGFWIPRRWFPDLRYWIPDFFYCNLDLGFQSLVGFRILWAGFRIPEPRISYSTNDIVYGFRIPQAKLSILLWGDSSNTHHASKVKASCITAHCCTLQLRYKCDLCGCGRLRVYETLPILINDLNKREKVSVVPGAGDHLS